MGNNADNNKPSNLNKNCINKGAKKSSEFAKFKGLSDEEIAAAANSDNTAQEYLLKKYKNFVRAKSRTYFLTGGDKEDIVQEGMIGLYKALRDFNPEKNTSFLAFAELCVTRQMISAVKSATRQKHQPLNTYVSLSLPVYDEDSERTLMDILQGDPCACPENIIIDKENYNIIENKIDSLLSPLEKQALTLYMDGKTYLEIAVSLNVNEKSVDNALHRAKAKIIKIKLQNDVY